MRKIIRTLFILLFFLNFFSFAPSFAESLNACNIADITYEQAMQQNKPVIIEFYADWCGYCKKFAPIFEDLKAQYSDKLVFLKINSDKSENSILNSKYKITSLPSVIVVDPKSGEWNFIPQGYYFDEELMKKQLENYIK